MTDNEFGESDDDDGFCWLFRVEWPDIKDLDTNIEIVDTVN
jgi:hypothetical protein